VGLSSPACLRGSAGAERFPCPCCGHRVFGEPPGSHEICPVCFWEDDEAQLRLATLRTGANGVTLAEGQRNFARLGACEASAATFVRPAAADEPRDPLWRPVDPLRDVFPPDATGQPYYWRRGAGHSPPSTPAGS